MYGRCRISHHASFTLADLPQGSWNRAWRISRFFSRGWLARNRTCWLGVFLSNNPLEKILKFLDLYIFSFAASCVALEAFSGLSLFLSSPPARAQLQHRALRGAGLGWARAGGER